MPFVMAVLIASSCHKEDDNDVINPQSPDVEANADTQDNNTKEVPFSVTVATGKKLSKITYEDQNGTVMPSFEESEENKLEMEIFNGANKIGTLKLIDWKQGTFSGPIDSEGLEQSTPLTGKITVAASGEHPDWSSTSITDLMKNCGHVYETEGLTYGTTGIVNLIDDKAYLEILSNKTNYDISVNGGTASNYSNNTWIAVAGVSTISSTALSLNNRTTEPNHIYTIRRYNVSSIAIDNSAAISVGKTLQLTATADPAEAPVKWTSADPTIVRVDESGTLFALKTGSTTVKAYSGGTESNECTVTVTAGENTVIWTQDFIENINAYAMQGYSNADNNTNSGISVTAQSSEEAMLMFSGGSINCMEGSGTITFTSSVGNIKGIEISVMMAEDCSGDGWSFDYGNATWEGTATNSVSMNVGNMDISQIVFTVELNEIVPVSAITLNTSNETIVEGNTKQLSVSTISPDNATDKTYTWSSSDESIATVDQNGKVTAIAAGTATIYATAKDGSGVKGGCEITVKEFEISPSSARIFKFGANQSVTLSTGGKSVTWASQTPDIASIDENGVVTYVSAGTAKITATAANGTTETCEIEAINGIGTPDRYASIEEVFSEPVYCTGIVTINGSKVKFEHTAQGSYDYLNLDGNQIYQGDWNVPYIIIESGTGTSSDPYDLKKSW